MKILISGTSSGLGKYLFETFDGKAYNRQTSKDQYNQLIKTGVDVILHCAFNSSKFVDSNNLYSYLNDNVLLTEKLIKIPHKKFIFISSTDVYPKDGKTYTEDQVIDINLVSGIYALTKLMSESLVKEESPNYLILRCSSLLGKYARKNTLKKMIDESKPILKLSPHSIFNYILHQNVSDFINLALKKDLKGIYNLVSSKNISLSEVAILLKKEVTFGDFIYKAGDIDNTKASLVLPSLKKTSKEILSLFLQLN